MQQLILVLALITHITPVSAMHAPEQPGDMNREHAIQIHMPQYNANNHNNHSCCQQQDIRVTAKQYNALAIVFIIATFSGGLTVGYEIAQLCPVSCVF